MRLLEEFERNTKYNNNRYKVKLPWNEYTEKFETNYDVAESRFRKLGKEIEKLAILGKIIVPLLDVTMTSADCISVLQLWRMFTSWRPIA